MFHSPSKKSETEEKKSAKRRSSVDSPYFVGKTKRSESEAASNYHILNLFGTPQQPEQQKEQTSDDPSMKRYAPFSLHNLDDPKQRLESPIYSNDDYVDNQFRQSLERIIDNEEN